MKNYFITSVVILLLLNGCAPVYKCGETKPKNVPITWSKNMKNVVRERDVLFLINESKEKENAG